MLSVKTTCRSDVSHNSGNVVVKLVWRVYLLTGWICWNDMICRCD